MRSWLLVLGLLWRATIPALAAMSVTIHDLKELPQVYYDQTISLKCYFDKESPIWVRVLPDADEWIGFFVTGELEKALTVKGEYYNLLFAPRDMQEVMRSLRSGDKITVVGEGFHYKSLSMNGVGIHVKQILRGWGSSAATIVQATSTVPATPTTTTPSVPPPPATPPVTAPSEPNKETIHAQAESSTKYTATINGKRYTGLRFGDSYNFDGIDFHVDKND